MGDIHVRVAQHHALRFPASKFHKRDQIAIGSVMPSRPGVAAVVRMEVKNTRPPTRALESGLDLPAAIGFALIGPPVRPTKDFVVSMSKPFQRLNDTRVKGNASRLTVLRGEKLDLTACEIDLPPIEIDGFRKPSARVEQENDEWSQVGRTCVD